MAVSEPIPDVVTGSNPVLTTKIKKYETSRSKNTPTSQLFKVCNPNCRLCFDTHKHNRSSCVVGIVRTSWYSRGISIDYEKTINNCRACNSSRKLLS